MAEFKAAIDKTLKHEGGFSNRKNDYGKLTYMGITERNNPNWEGWKIVRRNRPLEQGAIINDAELMGLVRNQYYKHYWQPIKGDAIESQKVAEFIFDWYVNTGRFAIKLIQRAIGIEDDGVVGNKTIDAINHFDEDALHLLLIRERTEFIDRLVARDNTQKVFYKGWMNRINSFA